MRAEEELSLGAYGVYEDPAPVDVWRAKLQARLLMAEGERGGDYWLRHAVEAGLRVREWETAQLPFPAGHVVIRCVGAGTTFPGGHSPPRLPSPK